MEEDMRIRELKFLSVVLIVFASATANSISPVAAEGKNQVSAHIDWADVDLSGEFGMAQTITPLNVPSKSIGNVDWSINMGNTQIALWPSFTLSNSGFATFAFFDVPAGSKVEDVGTATCNLRSGNAFLTPNTWRATCSAPLMPVANETYNFYVKPYKVKGSQWWAGFVSIGSTGKSISLGHLENNPSPAILNASKSMYGFNQITFWNETLPPCSKIPNFSAIIGPLITPGTAIAPRVSGKRLSETCPGLTKIETLTNLNSHRINIGNLGLKQETPKTTPTQSTNSSKPERPTFSLVNFTGNKINVNVDLGSGANKPDQIYLISPKIGATEAKKVYGKISGNIATWSFSLSKLLSGDLVPMKIVSLKNGIESDSLEENFTVPNLSSVISNKGVPIAPKNITSRVIGTSAFVAAIATVKSGALAKSASLYGSSLGISPSKPLEGEVIGTKVVFEIPIKSSMAGNTYSFTIYFENDAGKSDPVQGKISIPGLPKISTEGLTIPDGAVVGKTILCSKGSQARSFVAKSCPPGWKKA
jgi:hypothetical protein